VKTLISILLIVVSSIYGESPTTAAAQDRPKIAIIGFLSSAGRDPSGKIFLDAMARLGYAEGKNFRFEYRTANGKRERLPELAAEIVALKPSVILPSGPTAAEYLLEATRTIPLVLPNASADPVKAGYVKSLDKPGGNATGIAIGMTGLGRKRMELLKETIPSVHNVIFINPHQQPSAVYSDEYREAANALGVKVEVSNVRSIADIEALFTGLAAKKPDALLIERNSLTLRNATKIGEWVVKSRVPTMSNQRVFVEAGALISYGVDYPANWRRAAALVDKILKGADPATLPVEPPQLELVVNLKAANELGIKIPPEILLEANEVIK